MPEIPKAPPFKRWGFFIKGVLMKKISLLFIAFMSITSVYCAAADPTDSIEDSIKAQTIPTYLIILGSKKNYYDVLKIAKSISKKSGISYDDEGMIYDKKKGLIDSDPTANGYPSDEDDYLGRRGNGDFISIEKSEAYNGLKKGFYIIVGSIQEKSQDAEKMLKFYKKYAPDAYIQKTHIFMGCMH